MKIFSIYTLLLLAGLLTGAATGARAQDSSDVKGRWSVEGRADKMSDKISRQLGLNKDQDKEIYAINSDIVRRMDELRKNKSLTHKERMLQVKALNNERSQRFKSVLTASQYKRWNDWELRKKEHLEAKMEKKRQKKEARTQ
ncbi:hypothetical protein [Chitinophaga vietnamensis]|uniref:hypothetical protein n=1 Tax=Chitinophaga vietnamensis TaxID=2593957 RepID=UPI001177B6DC|nr:hypothetical protein [Chitinophaga vietnamensis]